jgi:hypothetical protein
LAIAAESIEPNEPITRDVPINTFTLRSGGSQITTTLDTFASMPGGSAGITPACNAFGLPEPARASFCAVLPQTSSDNQGYIRLSIPGAGTFSSVATFVADDILQKGSQCFTWIIPDAQLTCGVGNTIVLQWKSISAGAPFVLKQRTFTIDYFK